MEECTFSNKLNCIYYKWHNIYVFEKHTQNKMVIVDRKISNKIMDLTGKLPLPYIKSITNNYLNWEGYNFY